MELSKSLLLFASVFTVAVGAWDCPKPPATNICKEINLPRGCPKVPYVSNIDLDFIDGIWYQQFGTVDGTQAGCDGTCVTVCGDYAGDHNNTLEYCCNKGSKLHCGENVGSAVLGQQASNPKGVLTYYIFGIQVPQLIVDVEYDVYLVTYKCFYQGDRRTEIGEIWSRERLIDDETKQRLFDKLNDVFQDKDLLKPIRQHEGCPRPW